MRDEQPRPRACPVWCAGGHGNVSLEEAFLHASKPRFVRLADSTLCVHIESMVDSWAEDPPPGLITWECDGTQGPSMTAGQARDFIAVITMLMDQLQRTEQVR